jgi:hypothetical protein
MALVPLRGSPAKWLARHLRAHVQLVVDFETTSLMLLGKLLADIQPSDTVSETFSCVMPKRFGETGVC